MSDWHLPAALLLKLLVDLSLKGGVLLLLAVPTMRALRRGSAEQRYTTLTLIFHGLLFLPLLLPMHPVWRFPLIPQDLANGLFPAFVSAPTGAETGAQLMVLVWIAGLLIVGGRLVLALIGVSRLKRSSRVVSNQQWLRQLSELRKEVGLSRPVSLLEHRSVPTALAVGILRPAIILPVGADKWGEAKQRVILTHELVHHRRRDNLTNLVVQAVCALHWFNPLVWWAGRQLRDDRERACDDTVLRMGAAPSDYVESLISFIPRRQPLPKSVEVGQASSLKARLRAILDPTQRRTPVGWIRSASNLIAICCLLACLSLLDVWLPRTLSNGVNSPLELLGQLLDGSSRHANPLAQDHRHDALTRQAPHRHTRTGATRRHSSVSAPARGSRASLHRGLFLTQESAVTVRVSPALNAPAFLRGLTAPKLPAAVRPDSADVAQSRIRQIDLGTLGGDSSTAASLNDIGQVVGHSLTETGEQVPFVWNPNDGMRGIELPPTITSAGAVDINNRGQVLIQGQGQSGWRQTYVWTREEAPIDLGSLGGSLTEGVAINELGQVVGSAEIAPARPRAFFWSEETGLVNLGGQRAVAINNEGLVVARADSFSFVWREDLGFVRIGEVGVRAIPFDVNDRGEVVGMASFELDGPPRAFVWSLENGMVDLGSLMPDAALSVAYQINDQGQVVGVSRTGVPISSAALVGEIEESFLWSAEEGLRRIEAAVAPGMMLNNLGQLVGRFPIPVATSAGSPLFWSEESGSIKLAGHQVEEGITASAVALNERGQVIGNTRDLSRNRTRAVLWQLALP